MAAEGLIHGRAQAGPKHRARIKIQVERSGPRVGTFTGQAKLHWALLACHGVAELVGRMDDG